MIIKNALVYTPRHTFEKGSIVIREGRVVPFAAPEEGEEILDAQGLYALPGLVDIHFHGAMGKDFCDGTEEAIQTLADFEASKGVMAICPATIEANKRFFDGNEDLVPKQAYTMGIKTIMQARKVLVVANGLAKAKAVKAVVSGPVTPECPGSILQMHPDCILVADEEALSLL